MKISACLVMVCLLLPSAHATETGVEATKPAIAASMLRSPLMVPLSNADPATRNSERRQIHPSPVALAFERALKKGIIEQGVEGYTEVLIACQKQQSPLMTAPFLRSDSQQAHCYRF